MEEECFMIEKYLCFVNNIKVVVDGKFGEGLEVKELEEERCVKLMEIEIFSVI